VKVVFEQVIEIVMEGVFDKIRDEANKSLCELREKRKVYEEWSEERAFLDLLWNHAGQDSAVGKNGYVGSYNNCTFSILYEVFGVDIIRFLFNQAWVPYITINPFVAEHFLSRLATLEAAASELRQGQGIPVLLPETAPYIPPGSEAEMKSFTADHRFFLNHSFRELRDFGELGRSLQQMRRELEVFIHIWTPDGEYSDEIMAFAHKEREEEGEPSAEVRVN
jgi:hypothetical protein